MGAFPSSSGRRSGFFGLIGHDPPAWSGPGPGQLATSSPGRCVLAVADSSAEGRQAAWRAALVARDCGMPLHLLDPDGVAGEPSSDPGRAQALTRQVQQRLGVSVTAQAAGGDLDRALADLSPRTGLVVLPHRRTNALAERLFGTRAERIFRALAVPTLVVQRPAATSYRRVLVPVELDEHAELLVDAARCISRDPRIRVLHVLDRAQEPSLKLTDASGRALRQARQQRSRAAYAQLHRIIERASAADRTAALVSFGDAWPRVQEIVRARRAQLVVVGARPVSRVEQLFAPSVGMRLVSSGSADVLLLPVHERATMSLEDLPPWPMH